MTMGELNARTLGFLIAYILPGFVALGGLSFQSETLRQWLLGTGCGGPNLGGVFYILIGSLGTGMTLSAFRWVLLDSLFHRTGLSRPRWDDEKLPARLTAFEALVDNHFRYYQFYAHMLLALLLAYGVWRSAPAGVNAGWGWPAAGLGLVAAVFLAAARDALRNYYHRTTRLLGPAESAASHDERSHDAGRTPTATDREGQIAPQADAAPPQREGGRP